MRRTPVLDVLLLLLTCLAGCNSGSRSAGGTAPAPAPAAPVGSSAPTGGALRLVGVQSTLLTGSATPSIYLFVGGGVTNPQLLIDTGGGFVDSGETPLAQPGLQVFNTPVNTSAATVRYQVRGDRAGTPVQSNVIQAILSAYANPVVIQDPTGGAYDLANPGPARVAPGFLRWGQTPGSGAPGSTGSTGALAVLWRVDQGALAFEWVAEVDATAGNWGGTFAFGGAARAVYRGGSDPLPAGTYALTVVALSSEGWATHTSNDLSATSADRRLYAFRVN